MSDSVHDPFPFDPVPSGTNRSDGWTPERQRLFVRALAETGIVSAAARSVGMTRKTAYELLKRSGAESGFARAWREAQAAGRMHVWRSTARRWTVPAADSADGRSARGDGR